MDYELIKENQIDEYKERACYCETIKVSRDALMSLINRKEAMYIPVNDEEYGVIIECVDVNAECHKQVDRLADEVKYALMNTDIEKLEKFLLYGEVEKPKKPMSVFVCTDGSGDIIMNDNPYVNLDNLKEFVPTTFGDRKGYVVRIMASEDDDIKRLAYDKKPDELIGG